MENIEHSNKKYRKIGPYLLIKPIGKGTYSVVYEAKNETTKQKFAIKQISLTNIHQKQRQRLGQQIKVLKMIKHPNIVSMVDYKQTSRNLYLVFQHCKHTDLGIYIDKYYGEKLPEQQVRRIVVQLKKAFQVLRQNKIVHRDLKLANILVTQQFQIKIADFGFAKLLDDNAYFKSYVGTPLTMAPQILDKLQYNEKCDIWSLGVVIYQMLYGRSPFFTQQKMTMTQLKKALQSQVKYPFPISQQAKDLLNRAIVRDPAKRMSFEEFFNHPWIADDTIEEQNQLYKNLKEEALRGEIKKNLLKSARATQQKEYIIQSAENILAFSIIQHVKNAIEQKLMYWVNLGKRIMELHQKNKRLLYFALAVVLDNINLCKNSEYSVLVNEKRMIHLPKYMELRKLQTWEMTEYTRRLPNFLEKSYKSIFEMFKSIQVSFTNSDLDKKLIQHYLQELISQVQQNPQSQNISTFLKIKPYQGPLAYLKISSSTISEKTTKLLLTNMKLSVQNSKLLKKCSQIFKIQNIHRQGQLDKLYQSMRLRFG